MNASSSRNGFVLILVLGLLGMLAFLALDLVEHSRQAKTLSSASMLGTHTYLLARSGIERGKQVILTPYLATPPLPFAAPHPLQGVDLVVTLPVAADGDCHVRLGDANGRICLNDGINAGREELGSLYDASALDPWPAPAAGQTTSQQNVSAWINLRLRRLLNAYGDVHKFASDIGWPQWDVNADESATYNRLFHHTATDGTPRFASAPPRRFSDGQPVTDSQESAGLGDRIIGNRPHGGYLRFDQIRELVTIWGSQFLAPAYLNGRDFFDVVAVDFTLDAWHDPSFWRMKREFGANHAVFPGHAAFEESQSGQALQTEPPDFTDLWRHHPVPPINLNTASDVVRAAVFQAPTNISLISERDNVENYYAPDGWGRSWLYPASDDGGFWGLNNYQLESRTKPSQFLGVYPPPYISAVHARENGVAFSDPGAGALAWLQRKRHLSVRDAMVCARSYAGLVANHGWPDSFERFTWHLRRMMVEAKFLERAIPTGAPGSPPPRYVADPSLGMVDQWFLAECFPRILSTERRLPSWMGAPIALCSPWRTCKLGIYHVDLKVEDLVFRAPQPKVVFLPCGNFLIDSQAQLSRGVLKSRRGIRAHVSGFETRVLRDQASFRNVTDVGKTHALIQIGPEFSQVPGGAASSSVLGVVGLKDRGETPPGNATWQARYDFDGTLARTSGNILHQDPDNDNHHDSADALYGSALEGPSTSVFPAGLNADAGDLSPFGGIHLSTLRHGSMASGINNDSFYFRPDAFLLSAGSGGLTGTWGNKGLISLWMRVPTSFLSPHLRKRVFHLVLWERLRARLFNGTLEDRYRPITLSLSCRNRDAAPHPQGTRVAFNLALGVGNASPNPWVPPGNYYYWWYVKTTQLSMLPYPASEADFLGNPVYTKMMFPWNRTYTPSPGDWQSYMTAPLAYWFPKELGRTESLAPLDSAGPYVFRPGSWVRLVTRWDSSKKTHLDNMFSVVSHVPTGIATDPKFITLSPGGMSFDEMTLMFGEAQSGSIPSWPADRLTSLLDNVVIQFGGFPPAFDISTLPLDGAPIDRASLYNAVQNAAGFNNKRYDLTVEPAWFIDPGLPAGGKLLQFGARIHDVPFTPEYGNGADEWSSWPVKAPRIDVDCMRGPTAGIVVPPLARSLPVVEHGITLKSQVWALYPLPSFPGIQPRFRLKYRNSDTHNRALDAVLTDIPYINEISWRYVPQGGMRILRWEQE